MTTRAILVATGLFVLSFSPAIADSIAANVTNWDSATRTITLEDGSMFKDIPATVTVPAELKSGDNVTVDYEGSENGIDAINSVTINKDIAKRLRPAQKGG